MSFVKQLEDKTNAIQKVVEILAVQGNILRQGIDESGQNYHKLLNEFQRVWSGIQELVTRVGAIETEIVHQMEGMKNCRDQLECVMEGFAQVGVQNTKNFEDLRMKMEELERREAKHENRLGQTEGGVANVADLVQKLVLHPPLPRKF